MRKTRTPRNVLGTGYDTVPTNIRKLIVRQDFVLPGEREIGIYSIDAMCIYE